MIPDNDYPTLPPDLCPLCNQPWALHKCPHPEAPLCAPFDEHLSSALDWLDVANDAIKQAKHAIEEEALS